jgi:hypothetical protein
MTSAAVTAALAPLRDMLALDGYGLSLTERGDELVARITAGPEACEDCLVPKTIMAAHIERALLEALLEVPSVRLVYPTEA